MNVSSVLSAIRDASRAARELDSMRPAIYDALATYRRLEPTIRDMQERYGILKRVGLREALPIFRKLGWFGIERHLDPIELHHVVEIHRTRGGRSVDRFICRAFAVNRQARLRAMLKEWIGVSYIKARRRKLLAAVRAHSRREFALSIPLVLTFADGVAAAYFRSNPAKLRIPKGSRRPAILVEQAADLYRTRCTDYALLLTASISQQLYKAYDFGQAPPATLNRHGILHGDIADFDNEPNSLKAWLLLDALCVVALRGPTVP